MNFYESSEFSEAVPPLTFRYPPPLPPMPLRSFFGISSVFLRYFFGKNRRNTEEMP